MAPLPGSPSGMMYDLGVGTPLGLTALAYGLAGLTSGYVLSITPDPQWWLAAIFVAIGPAVGEIAIPVVKFLTGQEGWLDESAVRRDPRRHRVVDAAEPVVRAARSMVRRRQAAHVEGDSGMSMHRRRNTESTARARSARLADKNGAMAIDKRTTRLGVLALVSMLLIGAARHASVVPAGRRGGLVPGTGLGRQDSRGPRSRPSAAGSSMPRAGSWPTTSASSPSPSTGA